MEITGTTVTKYCSKQKKKKRKEAKIMKNIEIKRNGSYSMVLRMDAETEYQALYVVKNFDASKPDGEQWDCSEYYGCNKYGESMNFAAAERALEAETLRLPSGEYISNMYLSEFTPTNTEMIIFAKTKKEALEYAKVANSMIGPMDPDEDEDDTDEDEEPVGFIENDDNYTVEPATFDDLCDLISRRAAEYWGYNENTIIFDA